MSWALARFGAAVVMVFWTLLALSTVFVCRGVIESLTRDLTLPFATPALATSVNRAVYAAFRRFWFCHFARVFVDGNGDPTPGQSRRPPAPSLKSLWQRRNAGWQR